MIKTRFGRQVKKPVRYEPEEVPTDDNDREVVTDSEDTDSDSSDCDGTDEDSNGNLKDFVVYDDETDDEQDSSDESECDVSE